MAELNVSVTAPDRAVWQGTARSLIARTVEGDIGVMAGHEPFFALLADGLLRIERDEGDEVVLAVQEGFFSVDNNLVKILAEVAELATEIDVERAKAAIARAEAAGADDPDEIAAIRRAETRIDAAMHHERIGGVLH